MDSHYWYKTCFNLSLPAWNEIAQREEGGAGRKAPSGGEACRRGSGARALGGSPKEFNPEWFVRTSSRFITKLLHSGSQTETNNNKQKGNANNEKCFIDLGKYNHASKNIKWKINKLSQKNEKK